MGNISINIRLLEQIKDINELRSKCDNLSNNKIMVSKVVYDKAKKMAKELNTDVEGVFAITAYRLIDTKNKTLTHEMRFKRDIETKSSFCREF